MGALCTSGDGKRVFSRGLCQACYYRLRRNGSVERKNVARAPICSVEGCNEKPLAKNLCNKHYMSSQHPLTATWKLLRSRNVGDYPREWDSFAAFLFDVGERPSAKHQLRRVDGNLPYSKDNVRWLAPVGIPSPSAMTKAERRIYHRAWHVGRRFNLTTLEYEAMLDSQDHKCAICKKAETAISHHDGRPKALAVDHDHATGDVRGLLCTRCNRAIGYVDDSIEILRAAIAYLEKHTAK